MDSHIKELLGSFADNKPRRALSRRRSGTCTALSVLLLLVAVVAGTGTATATAPFSPGAEAGAPSLNTEQTYSNATVIEKYRQLLPQIIRENSIPGLSVAVVDDKQVLWAEGFGVTDTQQKRPVTADTLFSIQSMSKNFTAIGVLMAAQDGLVDLNTPISTYLPDFHVNSIFDEHPEQKMTLTNLLGHTAGFTHEAPVGNNYDTGPSTFEEHIKSISDTWLMYPVGQSYHYSNLGVDLAGYILQVRSGMSFEQYMQEKLLDPLGMTNSTFDMARISQAQDRAIGHGVGYPTIPVKVPMIPAGGLYSSANDMAKYLQFHINMGVVGAGGAGSGKRLVPESLLDTVYAPPSPLTRQQSQGYGVFVGRKHNTYYIGSGGGGFGFLSDLLWYPELKLGIVVVTNSQDHKLQGVLDAQILDDLIDDPGTIFHERAVSLNGTNPAPWESVQGAGAQPQPTADVPALIQKLAPAPTEQDKLRWAKYMGTYEIYEWGQLGLTTWLYENDNHLYLDYLGTPVKLEEVRPGVFFMDSGEALDLRGPTLLGQGIPITKVATGPPAGAATGTASAVPTSTPRQPPVTPTRAISITTATTATTGQPDFAAIDSYIASQIGSARVPGAALAIVQGDKVVHMLGFGSADPNGRAVTPQTPFLIGSVSKSFTALAIMQLVEAGKIDLDAPVQRYLPWFRVADVDASARITVRNLLNQTSGLSEETGRQGLADGSTDDGALERHVRALSTAQLSKPVGEAFQYSDANYITLGMIVQAVSGQTYEKYVQTHIFEPLQMGNSFTSQAEAQQHGMATGYRLWFGFPVAAPDMRFVRGAVPEGYLISSAEDLSHYLIAQLNGGSYAGVSVLSPAGIALMHQAAVDTQQTFSQKAGQYGMGWHILQMNGVAVVSHDGDTPNFHADVVLIPEGKWGVVLLQNANVTLTGEKIRDTIVGVVSLVSGKQPPPIQTDPSSLVLYVVLLAVPVVELAFAVRSARSLRKWHSHREMRPQGARGVALRLGLPLGIDMASALVLLVGLPKMFGTPLEVMLLNQPDLTWAIIIGGVFALAWGLLRTGISLWIMWRPGKHLPTDERSAPTAPTATSGSLSRAGSGRVAGAGATTRELK